MAKLRVVVNNEGLLDIQDAPTAEQPLQPEERRLMSALNRAMMETNSRLRPQTREKIRQTLNIPTPVQWMYPDMHPSLYLDLFPRGEQAALARECEREMLAVAATVAAIEDREGITARGALPKPDEELPTPKQEEKLTTEELMDIADPVGDLDGLDEEEEAERERFHQQVKLTQELAKKHEEEQERLAAEKKAAEEEAERRAASEEEDEHSCPHCDFVAGSRIGLTSHVRAKHKRVEA